MTDPVKITKKVAEIVALEVKAGESIARGAMVALAYRHEGELNADNLEAVITAMTSLKNATGRPAGIKPNLLERVAF